MTWLDKLLCAFKGHASMLAYSSDRLALRCVECGWESPGIEIGKPKSKPQWRNLLLVRGQGRRERKVA